jgi:hypothetical protein
MKFENILTICGAGALIIVLVICTITAVEATAAFITAYPAIKQLDNWRDKQRQLQHDQWQAIRVRINHALQYTPYNPELLRNLGLAHEAEYILYPSTNPSARMARLEAEKYYQQAILLRPSWPYDRIDFVLVKYRLGENDQNIYKLMRQATDLGPWEPRVQLVIAEIGLHHWESLPDEIREMVEETIHNSILHVDNTRDMLKLVRRYNMTNLVCDKQYETKEVIDFCRKYKLTKD